MVPEAEFNQVPPLEITLNPEVSFENMRAILGAAQQNLSLAFASIATYEPTGVPSLPTSHISFTLVPSEPGVVNAEHLKADFQLWLLRQAMGEVVRAIMVILQESHHLVTLASTEFSPISTPDLESRLRQIKKTAYKGTLPQLIDKLEAKLGLTFPFHEHLISINKARNCLEHRRGVVDAEDLTDKSWGVLLLKWYRLALLTDEGGRTVEVKRQWFTGGIGVADIETKKAVNFGSKVEIDVDEFDQIAYTCMKFGWDLKEQVRIYILKQADARTPQSSEA